MYIQATLYVPDRPPLGVSTDGLLLPDAEQGLARLTPAVAQLLGCNWDSVDVLAAAQTHVVWTVFDYEAGPVNLLAMEVVSELTGVRFELEDETMELRGPVLILAQQNLGGASKLGS